MEDHLSDEEIILAADGETSPSRAAEIRGHLQACWSCRVRQRQLEAAVSGFVAAHRAVPLPDSLPARQRLKASLSAAPASLPLKSRLPAAWAVPAAAVVLLGMLAIWKFHGVRPVYAPSPQLTPGVARVVDRRQLCSVALPKNQVVPAELRQRVFQAYGIEHADPRAYEVDYLITPALGGADDIRNLWPQPYGATEWNARVKDELEDRLRDMVCRGQLELTEAQHEIARDWIAAYKKYLGAAGLPK
jgi:hypothetical protein